MDLAVCSILPASGAIGMCMLVSQVGEEEGDSLSGGEYRSMRSACSASGEDIGARLRSRDADALYR
jgi:hypothetical protein